jgi:cytochrome c-type biogenesis protein CcmH
VDSQAHRLAGQAVRAAADRARTGRLAGRLLAAGLLAALLAASALPAWGLSDRELDERVQRITDMLRCPTCQGISVRDSEAAFSQQIRAKVRRMVEEGQTDDDIKAYFVSRYGEWILRAPPAQGLGLVVWLAPGAALVLAGGLLGWRLYRSHRHPAAELGAHPEQALTAEQRERIARDLQRFEEED